MSLTTLLSGHTTDAPATITGQYGIIPGNMVPGNYEYVITFQTAFGETAESFPTTLNTFTTSMRLTLPISTNPNVYIRNIYRGVREDIGGTHYLIATINDNSTTKYLDTTNDDDLGSQEAPTANLSRSVEVYDGLLVGKSYSCYGAIKCEATDTDGYLTAYQITTTRTFVTRTLLNAAVKLPYVPPKCDGMHLWIACDNNITDNDLTIYPFLGQHFRGLFFLDPVTLTSGFQYELLYANEEWIILGRCYIGFTA